MKIFHTETQADFYALMNGLEVKGIETLEKENWENNKGETVVFVHAIGPYGDNSRTDTTYGSLKWAFKNYPDIPIIKYKAKVNEMKFTKENVEKAINEYFWQADFESCGDLIAAIDALDDTPEKVVVPKFVADYLKERKRDEDGLFPSLYHFQHNFEDWSIKDWIEEEENIILFTKAWIDGYTIEPERFYCIPLPHLETADGTKQYLTKSGAGNYFALSPCIGQKQRYTKEELEQVPEIYKPFAKLIEEEIR